MIIDQTRGNEHKLSLCAPFAHALVASVSGAHMNAYAPFLSVHRISKGCSITSPDAPNVKRRMARNRRFVSLDALFIQRSAVNNFFFNALHVEAQERDVHCERSRSNKRCP